MHRDLQAKIKSHECGSRVRNLIKARAKNEKAESSKEEAQDNQE